MKHISLLMSCLKRTNHWKSIKREMMKDMKGREIMKDIFHFVQKV